MPSIPSVLTAGACSEPNNTRWNDLAYAEHPVVNVNWDQANAYATWAGGRLPTEAEWEKACRGTDGRIYPWGDEPPTAELANFANNVGDTTPVGSYPNGASPYGALDMAGNVWEWTADWYAADYYANSPPANPPGPATGDVRVVRGGAFDYNENDVRCAARDDCYPNYDVGDHRLSCCAVPIGQLSRWPLLRRRRTLASGVAPGAPVVLSALAVLSLIR